ncbi:DUF3857 domain-containing protein [Maribacter aquivivus]|uniref:DUF3857 domain-containing protein n=1 Tax=Maribacter aquivivus TaxID=228958 RepID=UPI0024955739|nr:DUF3857 domain-containing protein [Maribacter aquivivus]
MRLHIYIFLFLLASLFANAQQTKKTSTPYWVTPISITNKKDVKEEGAYKYLLLDYQDNLITKEQFVHYAFKILNSDGIQEMSDISASYDPEYQTIEFHKAQVIRDGEIIDKLKKSFINTFQRETNLERSLYDGSLTSVINLSDIRVGDIIEYSYSIKGFNPINEGNYSNLVYEEYTTPVNTIYNRILTDSNNPIKYKTLNGANEPKVNNTTLGKEYTWINNSGEYVTYDSNTPYWYNSQKRISVSTFNNWESVVELMTPYYKFPKEHLKNPITIDKELDSKQDVIIKLIRFVQDDIRYLGFESGIGAFKPTKPNVVLDRRYGDCKDKSLLLATLLQNQGISSFPILVNTKSSENLDKFLPSHLMFDHCIVYFEHGGEEYFVDPTISNQGGNLYHLYTPNYKNGLLLKEGSTALKKIPHKTNSRIRIVEDITVDKIGGDAKFEVKTEYFGSRADNTRAYFKNNKEESINKEYLNFYSSLYPSISSSEKVTYLDDSRPWENIFTTNEYYDIKGLWSTIENDETIYFDTNSLVLDGLISYNNSLEREMPYSAGAPFSFTQTTRILLPEPWSLNLKDIKIDNDYYSFSKTINQTGNMITLNYEYELKKDVIPAEDTRSFIKEHDDLRDKIGLQLTYGSDESESGISWLSIFIMLSSTALSIFFAIKIYKNYNPNKNEEATLPGQEFGGWLILPLIGLVLTPIVLIFNIYQNGYFDKTIWDGFEYAGYENAKMLEVYLGFELFYNFAFLTFAVLTILLFLQKRTSAPKMMIIFYACNLGITLVESFLMNQFDIPDPTATSDIFKAIVSSAIWIPYFLNSERVKNTFVNTYNNTESEIEEFQLKM